MGVQVARERSSKQYSTNTSVDRDPPFYVVFVQVMWKVIELVFFAVIAYDAI